MKKDLNMTSLETPTLTLKGPDASTKQRRKPRAKAGGEAAIRWPIGFMRLGNFFAKENKPAKTPALLTV